MTEESGATAPNDLRPSLLRSSLVTIGIPVPMLIALADSFALQLCQAKPDASYAYAAYGLFVSQTVLLGAFVGWQIRRQPLWWGILLWSVVLVDLRVFTISCGNRWSPANTLGVAFASAQAGALIAVAVLGAAPGRLRIPTAAIGLACTFYFGASLAVYDAWFAVLFLQALATTVVCLVLRWFGFRIGKVDLLHAAGPFENRLQFSIRHLFYWTTGVAIFLGLARIIGWQTVLSTGLLATDRELLAAAPPLTLVSILGVWGALGREAWIVRLGVLAVSLPGIGASLGAYSVWVANRRGRGWNWNLLFPAMQSRESIEVAIIWAVLAGILLAGLLLVFRTSGSRLMQKTK